MVLLVHQGFRGKIPQYVIRPCEENGCLTGNLQHWAPPDPCGEGKQWSSSAATEDGSWSVWYLAKQHLSPGSPSARRPGGHFSISFRRLGRSVDGTRFRSEPRETGVSNPGNQVSRRPLWRRTGAIPGNAPDSEEPGFPILDGCFACGIPECPVELADCAESGLAGDFVGIHFGFL